MSVKSMVHSEVKQVLTFPVKCPTCQQFQQIDLDVDLLARGLDGTIGFNCPCGQIFRWRFESAVVPDSPAAS